MTLHSRFPALAALTISSLLGLSVLAATGQFRTTDLKQQSLEELEKQIVDCRKPDVWCAYGDKLRAAGRFAAAAAAYQKVLEIQPDSPSATSARLNIAVALGQSKNADAFFAYFTRLSSNYPKVAVDLIERPELGAMKSDARWDGAAEGARAQAVD